MVNFHHCVSRRNVLFRSYAEFTYIQGITKVSNWDSNHYFWRFCKLGSKLFEPITIYLLIDTAGPNRPLDLISSGLTSTITSTSCA